MMLEGCLLRTILACHIYQNHEASATIAFHGLIVKPNLPLFFGFSRTFFYISQSFSEQYYQINGEGVELYVVSKTNFNKTGGDYIGNWCVINLGRKCPE